MKDKEEIVDGDQWDKTVHDRKFDIPVSENQKIEHIIILTIIGGNEIDFGKHFLLEKNKILLGRDEGNDIAINDEKVSKVHCEITVIKSSQGLEQILVKDLDSTNSTFVNNELIDQITLHAGDKIQIGDTVLRLSYNDELEKEYHAKLFNYAVRDTFTGLYNKRFIINELENISRIARRSNRVFSIIMIDIDDFKQINDLYGHISGDEYLKSIAELFTQSLREQDIAGRIGGEEFLIILPETSIDGAFQLAVRIRKNVKDYVLNYLNYKIRTTISAGVCQYENTIKDVNELLDIADQALYEAKRSGKNNVMQAFLAS
jgi:two-component system, cell cycle response regulator